MKCLILAATLAMSLAATQTALGRDPYREEAGIDRPKPVAWTPEPAPVAPPPGIYLVTDTYTGDFVTRAGPITTYSTETVHETTGSYARVLESVGTGGSSAYDGAAFNGRASLTDGRAVAGTYYENYIRSDGGFLPVSVVFFQDDSEIARLSNAAKTQSAAPAAKAEPGAPPAPAPAVDSGPGSVGTNAPFIDREDPLPVAPANTPVRASAWLPDRSVEVLRGRRTTLSLAGADVRAWRFVSGEGVAFGALAGAGSDPFVARWDHLALPNESWVVRFLVYYADGTSHELAVRVAVRSPGLVE